MQSSAAFFPAAMAVVLRGRDEHEARSHRPNEPARAVPALAGTIRRDHVVQSSLGSYAALMVGRAVEIRLRRHLWLATDEDTHESGFPQRTGASTDALKTCAICLESLLSGTAIVTACGHCYHTECARKSERVAIREYGHWQCPNCRRQVSHLEMDTLTRNRQPAHLDTLPDTDQAARLFPLLQRYSGTASSLLAELNDDSFALGSREGVAWLPAEVKFTCDSSELARDIARSEEREWERAVGGGFGAAARLSQEHSRGSAPAAPPLLLQGRARPMVNIFLQVSSLLEMVRELYVKGRKLSTGTDSLVTS